jgi:hypothetical protein
VEIVIGFIGLIGTGIGLGIAWKSRTDKLLVEIRDVLIEMRDIWRPPA